MTMTADDIIQIMEIKLNNCTAQWMSSPSPQIEAIVNNTKRALYIKTGNNDLDSRVDAIRDRVILNKFTPSMTSTNAWNEESKARRL